MPIPLVRVRGEHREVGRQIGEACGEEIREACDLESSLGPGQTVDGQRELAARYRDITGAAYPWLLDELEGVAEGAGADPLDVFAASIEEIWAERPSQPSGAPAESPPPRNAGGCSDIVAVAPVTSAGATLVAHNNDLGAASEARLIALEWAVEGEPAMFTIGIGPWISVGWNAAGLSLTGNELTPNDERIGIPRLLQVRDVLRQTSIDDAVKAALHPDRASSYCNLLAHRDGTVVCVEGSASAAELLRPIGGTLAHTNHYVHERMLRYEGDPAYAERSSVRYDRARALLETMAGSGEPVTPATLRGALGDHEGAPDSLCRHAADEASTKTVFWCVADVSTGAILFGRGNPCDSVDQKFAFADSRAS